MEISNSKSLDSQSSESGNVVLGTEAMAVNQAMPGTWLVLHKY